MLQLKWNIHFLIYIFQELSELSSQRPSFTKPWNHQDKNALTIGKRELHPLSDWGLYSDIIRCWMSIADLALRGGFITATVDPTNTEFCLGRCKGLGDDSWVYRGLSQFTLYFEKDIRCCKTKIFKEISLSDLGIVKGHIKPVETPMRQMH